MAILFIIDFNSCCYVVSMLLQGLPERRLLECTNPESPNFALKKRKMEWDSKKVIDLLTGHNNTAHNLGIPAL